MTRPSKYFWTNIFQTETQNISTNHWTDWLEIPCDYWVLRGLATFFSKRYRNYSLKCVYFELEEMKLIRSFQYSFPAKKFTKFTFFFPQMLVTWTIFLFTLNHVRIRKESGRESTTAVEKWFLRFLIEICFVYIIFVSFFNIKSSKRYLKGLKGFKNFQFSTTLTEGYESL